MMKHLKLYEEFDDSIYKVGDIVICVDDGGNITNDSYENSYKMLGKRISKYLKVNDKYKVLRKYIDKKNYNIIIDAQNLKTGEIVIGWNHNRFVTELDFNMKKFNL